MNEKQKGLLRSCLLKYHSSKKDNMIKDKLEIPVSGFLTIKVKNHDTNEEYYHTQEHNTITDIYKRNIVRLVGGDNVSSRLITKIKFGSGGHDPANPGNATPTTSDITDLTAPFLTKTITTKTFEDDTINNITAVIFETVLTTAEGNGTSGSQIYSEAGLYTYDETPLTDPTSGLANTGICAVKHFGVLTKTSALSFTFQWKLIL